MSLLLVGLWLALRTPEACEADGPIEAALEHVAALGRAWW